MNLRHAATHVALYRRARHRAVRAEHAAIAREGLEPFATALAVIEELAGIGRHRLDSLIAAFGASECGLKLHIGSASRLSLNILFQLRFLVQNRTQQRIVNLDVSVVIDETKLAKLVPEMADADRVVPIISVNVS